MLAYRFSSFSSAYATFVRLFYLPLHPLSLRRKSTKRGSLNQSWSLAAPRQTSCFLASALFPGLLHLLLLCVDQTFIESVYSWILFSLSSSGFLTFPALRLPSNLGLRRKLPHSWLVATLFLISTFFSVLPYASEGPVSVKQRPALAAFAFVPTGETIILCFWIRRVYSFTKWFPLPDTMPLVPFGPNTLPHLPSCWPKAELLLFFNLHVFLVAWCSRRRVLDLCVAFFIFL